MLRFDRVITLPLGEDVRARALRLRLRHDERARSRLATMTQEGHAAAVVLPRGTTLAAGAALTGEDGLVAIVEPAVQALARVSAVDAPTLLRVVYHLANRHVPAQLAVDHVLIEQDAVLESMLIALGARVEHVEAAFEPEPGAYHGGHAHHGHGTPTDERSASVGEQLSIAAHARRGAA